MTTNTATGNGIPEGLKHDVSAWFNDGPWRYKVSHSCCGVLEVHGLQDDWDSGEDGFAGPDFDGWEWQLMASLAWRIRMDSPFGCVIFSAAEEGECENDDYCECECEECSDFCCSSGPNKWECPVVTGLAWWIKRHGFGEMLLTPIWHNPNSGNECVVGVWSICEKARSRLNELFSHCDYGDPYANLRHR